MRKRNHIKLMLGIFLLSLIILTGACRSKKEVKRTCIVPAFEPKPELRK